MTTSNLPSPGANNPRYERTDGREIVNFITTARSSNVSGPRSHNSTGLEPVDFPLGRKHRPRQK
jgi:hypothetical protein